MNNKWLFSALLISGGFLFASDSEKVNQYSSKIGTFLAGKIVVKVLNTCAFVPLALFHEPLQLSLEYEIIQKHLKENPSALGMTLSKQIIHPVFSTYFSTCTIVPQIIGKTFISWIAPEGPDKHIPPVTKGSDLRAETENSQRDRANLRN